MCCVLCVNGPENSAKKDWIQMISTENINLNKLSICLDLNPK